MQKYKTIEEFLGGLSKEKRLQVDALRDLILKTQPQLQEHIKWNAPSYVLDGDDRITFNLINKQQLVKIILHMDVIRKENKKGAPLMQNDSGLIEWSSDIRGTITFASMEDVTSNLTLLQKIIKDWLAIPSATD